LQFSGYVLTRTDKKGILGLEVPLSGTGRAGTKVSCVRLQAAL